MNGKINTKLKKTQNTQNTSFKTRVIEIKLTVINIRLDVDINS